MAKAYRCDRCLEYFSRAISPDIQIIVSCRPFKAWDLCPECQQKLEDWMNRKEEELTEIKWAEKLEKA